MKTWILSVIAITVIISLISVLLPNGRTSKTIRGILAFLSLLIFIQPVLSLKDKEFNFDTFLDNNHTQLQNDYLSFIADKKDHDLEVKCEELLKTKGYMSVKIDIKSIYNENNVYVVKKVIVNLSNSVLISDKAHIDIIEDIKSNIALVLGVDKNSVDFVIDE